MAQTKKKNAPVEQKRTSRKAYKKYKPVLERMQEESQNYMVLKYILENGSITPKEAEKKPIRSMRLSARIWDLKHIYDIPIEKQLTHVKRGKKTISFASYYIGD